MIKRLELTVDIMKGYWRWVSSNFP